MEINEHILIDAFLNENLSGKSLEEFNARLENEHNFKVEVELQKLANLVIVNNERMKIKAQLQQIHVARTRSSANGRKWRKIGVPVLIIGLLLSMWYFNQNDKKVLLVETQEISDREIKNETNSTRTFNIENEEIKTPTTTKEQIIVPQEKTPEEVKLVDKKQEKQPINQPNKNLSETTPEVAPNEKPPEKRAQEPIEKNIPEQTIDPCLGVNEALPNYQLIKPCFGGNDGEITFNGLTENDISFSEFSIDGGDNYYSSMEKFKVSTGTYQVIAKNNIGGLSKIKALVVNYADCNFVIQPNYNKYWEVDVPELTEQIIIEIRNARTGVLVFQKNVDSQEKFIWEGVDSNNNQLNMGNYVYWLKSAQNGVFAKGQITLIK